MSNNNNSTNNNKKQYHDKQKLHQSSRFTPKIREYLAEMARDRETELERFMALSSSSPASSISVGAPSCAVEIMRSCSGSRSRSSRCRSGSVGSATGVANRNSRADKEEVKITQIPIVMHQEEEVPKPVQLEHPLVKPSVFSASVEDLCTPTKSTQTQGPQMQTRKTQTPESALKSHKRLEWDPAADVGYRCERAMSTSNISTLERSVLEAVIQPTQRSNQSETDLNRLHAGTSTRKAAVEQTSDPPAPAEHVYSLPASSEHVYILPAPAPLASSTFQSFNRSTLSRNVTPRTSNRSTQAPSSSRVTSSAASSFDYHQAQQEQNSRATSATSIGSSSRSRHTLSADELLRHVEQQRQEREYAAKLEQVLCNRQNKENQQPNQQKNRSTVAAASSSAASTSSVASSLPPATTTSSSSKCDLDLGIDLLCSLVNKRSLSQSQKKQLVRDIAKRLALLDLSMSNTSSRSHRRSSKSSKHKVEPCPTQEQVSSQTQSSPRQQAKPTVNRDAATNTSRQTLSISSSSASSGQQQKDLQTEQQQKMPVAAPRRHLGTPSPLPVCSYASTSSGASNELITQKINIKASMDQQQQQGQQQEVLHEQEEQQQQEVLHEQEEQQQQEVLQEWLTPMTQSELDYEQKKKDQEKLNSLDTERRTQLNWIETEIQRLRKLQQLLHDVQQPASRVEYNILPCGKDVLIHMDQNAEAATVQREKILSKTLRAAPPPPHAEKLCSPAAALNIPIVAVPAATVAPCAPNKRQQQQQQRSKMATPPLSHSGGSSESVCSFVQQRQRQFMAHYQNQQQQRLEQQHQQKQLLRLQQHQQMRQQQHQQFFSMQQQLEAHAVAGSTCHMRPHQQHCQYYQQHHAHPPQQQQQQHYMQMANGYSCLDEGAVYYQVVNSQGVPCNVQATAAGTTVAIATATTLTTSSTTASSSVAAAAAAARATSGAASAVSTTNSTSSMLCISSEMSIPMGRMNACEATTTTTTTTTHQYDDVACQQLQLRRTSSTTEQHLQQQQSSLQVRPRGIAYVIQFSVVDGSSEIIPPEMLSLQDQLQRARPQFCAKSKQRKAILNQMQLLRNDRRRELDELVETTSLEMLDKRLDELPPPATSRMRIFTTREMKALTLKRCESLPEVLAAQHREREERRRRSNRVLRDAFNRRLQRRVRNGKLSLNHSRTVI